jgi:hypothetical protein
MVDVPGESWKLKRAHKDHQGHEERSKKNVLV